MDNALVVSSQDRTLKVAGQVVTPTIINPTDWRQIVAYFVTLQDVKESSKQTYIKSLSRFFDWIEKSGRDISKLTRVDILDFKESLSKSGISANTQTSYIVSLRKFYEFLESEKVYPNIAKSIKTPKRKSNIHIKHHLTDGKASELLTYFEEKSLRDFAIVNLLLRTGLRTIEIVNANIEDITTLSGEVSTQRVLKVLGKGREDKTDFVILTNKAYEPIRNYLETCRKGAKKGEPLFVSNSRQNRGERLTTQTISKLCREGLDAIGLDGAEFSAHSLRHTTAVSLINKNVPLQEVQRVLRHTSPTTTQIYLESIKDVRRLDLCVEETLDNAF